MGISGFAFITFKLLAGHLRTAQNGQHQINKSMTRRGMEVPTSRLVGMSEMAVGQN